MSLYGEWKAGILTDSEYTALCKREALRDKAIEDAEWEEYLNEEDPDDIDE